MGRVIVDVDVVVVVPIAVRSIRRIIRREEVTHVLTLVVLANILLRERPLHLRG